MDFRNILSNTNNNKHYIDRYIKFIEKCNEKNVNIEVYEKHHILPVSIFPEYKSFKKFPNNKILLTPRQHFISHWMLAKIFGGKQWFSFNMMKRTGTKSRLYEYGRKYIVEQIRNANKGRIKTVEERTNISKRTKNTLLVKDVNGTILRVSTNDPRYISGELVFYRTGTKHSSETKKKMSENGISGKKPFILNEKVIYLSEKEGRDRGLSVGIADKSIKKISDHFKSTIWVTEKDTLKYRRIKPENFDDKNHIKGKLGFEGFKHINDKRKKIQ